MINANKSVEILTLQIEELLRCNNCKSAERALSIITSCGHLICKNCCGSNCRECYSTSVNLIQPTFLEYIPTIINEIKRKL